MDSDEGLDASLAPVRLSDRPIFDEAFSQLREPVSDSCFASTYVWAGALRIFWTSIDRHLCVFANTTGDLTMLLPPVPQPGAEDRALPGVVGACFEIMDAYNARNATVERSRIEYVSDEMLERFSASSATLSATPMWGDYVYETARMIDLAGGPLKSKRHARSRFMRERPDHRVEDLRDEHVPACFELLDAWAQHGDEMHEGEVSDVHVGTDVLRERDRLSTRRAIEHRREIGLTGMALIVEGRLAGFTLGQPLTHTQAMVLVEKADPDLPGAAQFLFSEFCRRHWAGYAEVNAGDDWGIPSLRFTKQSYRPRRLLSKYVLTRQPVPVMSTSIPMDLPVRNPRHTVGADAPASESASTNAPVTVILRRGAASDADPIIEVELSCFDAPDELFTRRQVKRLIDNPRATVTVAELDGRVVGWAVGLVRQHRRSRSGRLYAVAVHPSVRGRHAGRLLVEATIDALKAKGVERVYLEVRHDNATAISLYRKLGFLPTRDLPGYYGADRDGLRMRLGAGPGGRLAPRRHGHDAPGEGSLFTQLP
ncbi:MAG: GNAT family N-acetyltransferase [Phycisphaerales bacterium]|nr:GNAT family N-acetyltransferase [Phycisphaerales bacterium]